MHNIKNGRTCITTFSNNEKGVKKYDTQLGVFGKAFKHSSAYYQKFLTHSLDHLFKVRDAFETVN